MNSNIDNLNFAVIIDDTEFNNQIKKMEAEAKRFNTSMSSLLDLKKQAQQWSQKDVENNRRAWQAKVDEERAQEKINKEKIKTDGLQRKINAQIERATKGYQTQSRILKEMKSAILGYLSIQSAGKLLTTLVNVTGEFELQKTTLAAMLGDLNAAEQIITRIQGLAIESPFQFKELTTYAKQLSAFSVPAQELYDTTKMLADISAGLGVGMDRIVLAYGQVRSAAFLRGQEVRQFTEAGIPILDELAKQFSEIEGRVVSTGEVFDKISARLVPFEMVAKVFKDMTSEGGKFYNMQEIQAETLKGKLSNLKDAYEVMLNEIGKGQSENLKGAFDWARKLMQNYEETGRTLVELVAAYGTYKVALVVATNMQATLARNLVVLRREFRALTATLSANPYALLAAGITAVGFGIYKAATSLKDYEKIQKAVTDTQKDYTASIALETTKLDSLYAKLRVAKKGTEEYDKAKKAIYTQYASYISDLKAEGKEVENLAGIYNDLKDKIEASAKAKYRMTASQSIESEYSSAMDAFYKRFELLSTNMGNTLKRKLMEVEKEALWQYMLGDETALNIPAAEGIRGIAKDMGPRGYGYLINKAQEDAKTIIDTYTKAKERIDALFGADVPEPTTETPIIKAVVGEKEGESPAEKVQKEIEAVRRLRDAYDTLAPYMNGEMLRKTLTALFPNADQQLIQSLDFRGKLVALAAQLNEFDQNASQKLLDSISGEKASEIASAFKAIETYKNMLDSWLGEDFNLTGEGVAFDINKIMRDLNNQYAKINKRAIQANDLLTKAQMGDEQALKTVREVYGDEVWQRYLTNGKRTIDELSKLERDAARKTADEKIRDLSSKYISEQMSKNNIDLSDFGDKTTAQIQSLIDRLKGIQEEAKQKANESLVDVMLGRFDEGEYAKWQMFLKVIEEIQGKIEDTEEELEKSLFDKASNTMGTISDLGGEISSLGDALEDSGIAKFGEEIERISNTASGLIKAFQAKDTLAIIANFVSYAISSITDILSSVVQQQVALNDATREYREILLQVRRDSYSGIFGTDEMALAAENARILAEAQEEYRKALNAFENDKKLRRNKYSGAILLERQSVADIVEDIAGSQGWDLYRQNGELNIEQLKAYYDAFSKHLTRQQKEVVDALIEGYDAQNDAAAQSAEYITQLFGNVADNIASSMIDAFLESGDAAIDMGNVVSDVSKQMVSDLIKTLYLMPILNKYKDKIAEVDSQTDLSPTEATEKKLGYLDMALQEISEQSGNITDTIERFEEYLGGKEGAGTTDLAQGIKGITEDQANLLASYLNAIRADVSFSKTLWVKMDANLQKIADMFVSSPTLMEYQAQIAANTYNTAMATQEILSELRGVVTTETGASSIRVYKDN